MATGDASGSIKQVARSRPVVFSLVAGLVHAIAAVSIRIWSGVPTAIWDPSFPWMLVGGLILGATFTYLYVGRGLKFPAAVALVFLLAGGWATRWMYVSAGENALAAAFTPMTLYVTFWPLAFTLVVLVGASEWAVRNRGQLLQLTPE